MSRPIAPMRSLALVAALLVSTQVFAATPAAVKKKPSATGQATSAKSQAKATTTKSNVATKAAASKQATAAAAKAKAPVVAAKRSASKPAQSAATATASAKAGARQPGPKVAAVAPRPEPQMYVPPPLGPERYYPNGIPELRPEFLHPLPGAQAQASRQDAMNAPVFTAPQ